MKFFGCEYKFIFEYKLLISEELSLEFFLSVDIVFINRIIISQRGYFAPKKKNFKNF